MPHYPVAVRVNAEGKRGGGDRGIGDCSPEPDARKRWLLRVSCMNAFNIATAANREYRVVLLAIEGHNQKQICDNSIQSNYI